MRVFQIRLQIQIVLTEGGTWPFGRVMCYAYVFTVHAAPAASAGILVRKALNCAILGTFQVLLSIERYIAVLHPILINTLLTKRRLCLCTLIMYVLCILSNVPYLYQVHNNMQGMTSSIKPCYRPPTSPSLIPRALCTSARKHHRNQSLGRHST